MTKIHNDPTCPCHEFSAKSPSETYYGHPRLDTGADLAVGGAETSQPDPQYLFHSSEGLNRQETQNRAIPVSGNEQKSVTSAPDNIPGDPERLTRLTIDPYEYLKTFKYAEHRWKCACGWSGSPSEMTVSNELRTCPECDGSGGLIPDTPEQATPDSLALRRTRSILHHAEMVEEQKRAQLTFDQRWQEAPKSIKHGCEETSAEFFYHAGRRDRETEMLREVNKVLSGVVGRIERERVR